MTQHVEQLILRAVCLLGLGAGTFRAREKGLLKATRLLQLRRAFQHARFEEQVHLLDVLLVRPALGRVLDQPSKTGGMAAPIPHHAHRQLCVECDAAWSVHVDRALLNAIRPGDVPEEGAEAVQILSPHEERQWLAHEKT